METLTNIKMLNENEESTTEKEKDKLLEQRDVISAFSKRSVSKSEVFIDEDFYKRLALYLSAPTWKKKKISFKNARKVDLRRQTPISDKIWFLSENVNVLMRLHESAEILTEITESKGYYLYIVTENMSDIFIFPKKWKVFYSLRYSWPIMRGETIASYVAKSKLPVITNLAKSDERFSKGQDIPGLFATEVLAVPILNFEGFCIGVIEFYRDNDNPYSYKLCDYIEPMVKFASQAISQNKKRVTYESILKHMHILFKEINKDMTTVTAKDTTSFYITILEYTKKVVDVSKVSIFVSKNGRTIREVSTDDFTNGFLTKAMLQKEVKLAELTLKSGWTSNMPNVFNDLRFDKNVDLEAGYLIRTALNISFGGRKRHIGALQAINKLSGGSTFAECEEMGLTGFTNLCAIWYYYTNLLNCLHRRICGSKQYENLIYDVISRKVAVREYFDDMNFVMPPFLKSFDFNITSHTASEWPKLIFIIFQNLSDVETVHPQSLYRFVKMTRALHGEYDKGFEKAVGAMQFLFAIINVYWDLFDQEQKISLMLATFCTSMIQMYPSLEELDNKNDLLLQLFDNYFIERYVFKFATFLIKNLQLFKNLSNKAQMNIINMLEKNILSTSYHRAINVFKKISNLMIEKKFDYSDPKHQKLLMSLIMFGNVKLRPFSYNTSDSQHFWKEFFEELMLITKKDKFEKSENSMVGHKDLYKIIVHQADAIVFPILELLAMLLPKLSDIFKTMADNCKTLLNSISSDLSVFNFDVDSESSDVTVCQNTIYK